VFADYDITKHLIALNFQSPAHITACKKLTDTLLIPYKPPGSREAGSEIAPRAGAERQSQYRKAEIEQHLNPSQL